MGHPLVQVKLKRPRGWFKGMVTNRVQDTGHLLSRLVRVMWTLVASLRKELRRRRITPHSTSVDGMPRGGAESGHARSGELLGRGGTHARHTPAANMACSDATFKIFSR